MYNFHRGEAGYQLLRKTLANTQIYLIHVSITEPNSMQKKSNLSYQGKQHQSLLYFYGLYWLVVASRYPGRASTGYLAYIYDKQKPDFHLGNLTSPPLTHSPLTDHQKENLYNKK
jgi:hypothetical protein